MFKEGQSVYVPNGQGVLVEGIIEKTVYLAGEAMYWVSFIQNNPGVPLYRECDLHSEEALGKWNKSTYSTNCECGSAKLNHPGHDEWCPKYRRVYVK